MSISTMRGDSGKTSLIGEIRVSKSDLRVDAYGTVDELNTVLGFARSICQHPEIKTWTEQIQRSLFRFGSNLATSPQSKTQPPQITREDVDLLTERVHELEAMEGLLTDWSLPGAYVESAAFEIARTICRRAERNVVRLAESGEQVDSNLLAYLNRLSDLIWLFGRLIERDAGVNSSLHGHFGCACPHRQ